MPRVLYIAPNADPEMDNLTWEVQADGALLSPELPEEAVARYLTIPGFHAVPEPTAPVQQPPVTPALAQAPEPDAGKPAGALPLRGGRAKPAATNPPPAPADADAPATEQTTE